MAEHIILGTVQGIAEWLPVSSEGVIVLIKTNFFHGSESFTDIVKLALFLHLGTFLAAFIYFYKDVANLLSAIPKYTEANEETKKIFTFLLISTLISGGLGIVLIKCLSHAAEQFESAGRIITGFVGVLLLGTGWLQLKAQDGGQRAIKELKTSDSIILGIVQGLAALPGFSRSGLTVSALLLLKMDKASALRLSFLMSLPIVLAGNIILNFSELNFSTAGLVGLFFSFLFGLLTIHLLLKVAEKINFGLFVILFGLLAILAAFI